MTRTLDAILADIKPVTVGNLAQFVKAVEPLLHDLMQQDQDGAIAIHFIVPRTQNLIDAVTIGAGVEPDWLKAQPVDVLIKLGTRVLEVNSAFFLDKIMPALNEANATLSEKITSKLSSIAGSVDSSAGDLTTKQ